MTRKTKRNFLRSLGLTLVALALANLIEASRKSFDDSYTFTIWSGHTDEGVLIQKNKENEKETLAGDYRVQLLPQTHVPIGNVRSWILTSTVLLCVGILCLISRELLEDKPKGTNQSR